jgi:hypothetical protein
MTPPIFKSSTLIRTQCVSCSLGRLLFFIRKGVKTHESQNLEFTDIVLRFRVIGRKSNSDTNNKRVNEFSQKKKKKQRSQ